MIAAALLAAGCAGMPGEQPIRVIAGFEWEHDPERPRCERVEWVKVPWDRMQGVEARAALYFDGRVEVGCQVFSGYSEADARALRIPGTTETIYDHEARHVMERLRHPEKSAAQRTYEAERLKRSMLRR